MSHHLLQPGAEWKNRRTQHKRWKQATVPRFSTNPRFLKRAFLVMTEEMLPLMFLRRGRNADQTDQTAPGLRLRTAALNDTQRLFSAVGISGRETTSLCLRSGWIASLHWSAPASGSAAHHLESVSYNEATQTPSEPWLTLIQRSQPRLNPVCSLCSLRLSRLCNNTDLKQVNWGFSAPINRHWRGNK